MKPDTDQHSADTNPERRSSQPAAPLARRRFLGTLGVAAAGAGATLVTGSAHAGRPGVSEKTEAGVSRVRSVAARSVRVLAARDQFQAPSTASAGNADESRLAGFIASFAKTLPHNNLGEVDPAAYRSLLKALEGRDDANWGQILLSPDASRKLANPRASLAFSLEGGDSHASFMPPAPEFASAETAAEMAEVYLHALLRDIPFDEYQDHPDAAFAAAELSTFSAFSGPREGGAVTPGTLFRGSFAGDLSGNYLSQFLLLPIPQGAALTAQRYQTTLPGDDHMLDGGEWLHILRGGAPASASRFDPQERYISAACR